MVAITIQNRQCKALAPPQNKIRTWVSRVLKPLKPDAEVNIRIVTANESAQLNFLYRKKNQPTNVLSFPADLPEELNLKLLGDVVICAEVVNREASAQHKTQDAHWAHMLTHGILHLLGYDHEIAEEAEEMEALEINLLNTLGFPNPYAGS